MLPVETIFTYKSGFSDNEDALEDKRTNGRTWQAQNAFLFAKNTKIRKTKGIEVLWYSFRSFGMKLSFFFNLSLQRFLISAQID